MKAAIGTVQTTSLIHKLLESECYIFLLPDVLALHIKPNKTIMMDCTYKRLYKRYDCVKFACPYSLVGASLFIGYS